MEHFCQNGEFFSQERRMRLENFLRVNSFGAFQPISSPTREKRVKEVEVEKVEMVEKRSVQEENDCEIKRTSKKRAAPKKKATQIEVKVEGEERNQNWYINSLPLKGEMEPEFERNGKKQAEKTLNLTTFFCK